MASLRNGEKLLSEPMVAFSTNTYMRQSRLDFQTNRYLFDGLIVHLNMKFLTFPRN